jgi:hypothetical protein
MTDDTRFASLGAKDWELYTQAMRKHFCSLQARSSVG